MIKLSVIILSYNTKKITQQCLESLFKSLSTKSLINYEVIVVDNGSTDSSQSQISRLRASFAEVATEAEQDYGGQGKLKIIFNDKNIGYPRGNNQALKVAKEEYVLFLNSDVIIERVNFHQLLNYLDSRPDVGVLTVKVKLTNGQIDPASHRGFPTIWNSFCYFLKLEKLFGKLPVFGKIFAGYHLTFADLRTIHEIDSPSGAFYLTRKKILDKIGGFDEDYFMYGEDLDLSFRIKELGYKILYYPLFSVTHLKYSSGLRNNDEKERQAIKDHFYKAMKIFYKKHYEQKNHPLINNLIYFFIDLKKKIS
jgi:hypothetical protein